MGDSKELREAYDRATAVMTRPVRFVEWKMYEARGTEAKDLRPFGVGDKSSAWKEIEGERWIYVFRGFANVNNVGIWIDELHVDAKGEISATPMDNARVAPDKRAKPVAVGKSISFARRILGHAMAHYFFAARVRLSVAAIDELQSKVYDYVPPVTFDLYDLNTVTRGDELLVPVLDPITVAMHLHAYYVAAADGVTDYVTTHAGQSNAKQTSVQKRLKKVQLGRLLKAVVDADKTNAMVNRLSPHQAVIDDFLDDYRKQVEFRIRWRDRWASYLANWLRARPMKLVEAEHLAHPKELGAYLVPFCMSLSRTNESPEGRKLLGEIFADDAHFAHKYIFPKGKQPEQVFAISRKFVSATLEGLKEFGPTIIHLHKTPELISVAVRSLQGWEFDIKQQTHVLRGGYTDRKAWVITYKNEATFEPAWEGAANKIAVVVELLNAALALKEIIEAAGEDDPDKLTMAILEGVGAASHLTAAILELKHASKRTVAVFGFVSACIDMYMGAHEVREAYDKGDATAMQGAYVTTGGAFVTAMGWALVMAEVPGGQIIVIAGLAVQAIGRIISMFKKSEYELYAEHCVWGERYGLDQHKPEYSTKRFGDWKDDYDEQFRALIGLVCRFSLEKNSTREAEVKVGFLPSTAWLKLHYVEKWRSASDSADYNDFVQISDGKPMTGVSNLIRVAKDGDSEFLIKPIRIPTSKPLTETYTVPDDLPSQTRMTVKNSELDSIKLSVQLVMMFGDEEFFVPREEMMTADLS